MGTGWLLARGDVTVKPADTRKGKQAEAKHLELEKGGWMEGGREGGFQWEVSDVGGLVGGEIGRASGRERV